MIETPLTVTAVQKALDRSPMEGGFYGNPKSLAIIERAVEIGVVRRISTTQAEWEDDNSADELKRYISATIEENEGDMPMVEYKGREYRITYRREITVEADSLDNAKAEFEEYSKSYVDAHSSYVEMSSIEDTEA